MEYYKNCDELPLKIFFDVANGEIEKLIISGKVEKEILLEVWESILLEYGKRDNNNEISDVFEKRDEMFRQAALFCEIKGMLLYLLGAYKQEYIDRLLELGYRVDVQNNRAMIESIKLSDRRSNHISTKLQLIQKDIEKYNVDETNKSSFEGTMAWLSFNLGFEPKESITVGRFLEYKKQIHERNKAKRRSRSVGAQLA